MARSKFDELHDKYFQILTTKSGTRYERLAAFVFKALNESGIVIHDLKLVGDTGVKHQIDVVIEQNGVQRRTLIECKDFDISGEKVGLDIVRNFWAVVDDTHPDESIIITCNDFTRDAQKYAKAKGIKLAILRQFRDEDWEGRIKKIIVDMQIQSITEPKVKIGLNTQEDIDKFNTDLTKAGITGKGILKGQPVFLNTTEGRFQINDFIQEQANAYPRDKAGPVKHVIPMDNSTIEVENNGGVPIKDISLEFEVVHTSETFEVTSKKVAELIIKGLQDDDLIIFDEHLRSFKIAETSGEIVPKP